MAKEVTPELLSRLETYLNNRSRGETKLLLSFFKEVFDREPNLKCPVCIEEDAGKLKRFLIKKKERSMERYKWVGPAKASVIISIGGDKPVRVDKTNCTDKHAEAISLIPKYAHLVECIAPAEGGEPLVVLPKKEEDFIKVELPVTTSTSTTAQTDGSNVRKKKRKRGSK